MISSLIQQKTPEIIANVSSRIIRFLRNASPEDIDLYASHMSAEDGEALRAMVRACRGE